MHCEFSDGVCSITYLHKEAIELWLRWCLYFSVSSLPQHFIMVSVIIIACVYIHAGLCVFFDLKTEAMY